jgi:hypothetical protein
MNSYWSFIKQNSRYLSILAAVFIVAILSAILIGRLALKSCLWALLLVIFSGIVGILPVIRNVSLRPTISISCVLLTNVIRFVIMLTGSISILFLTQISVIWFVSWIAVFYLPMIAVEVLIITSLINTSERN